MVEPQPALPLVAPLELKPEALSARTTLRRAFALGMASLILSTGVYFSSDQNGIGAGIFMLLALVAFLVSLFTPWVVAVVATTSTAHALQTDEYHQTSLSAASNIEIVWGYVLATFYRVCVLLVLVIGLMPVVVLGGAYSGLFFGAMLTRYDTNTGRLVLSWTASTLSLVGLVVGLWGMNLFAAALGVWLVLWIHHSSQEVKDASSRLPKAILFVFTFALTILVMILSWVVLNKVILLYALVPYLLGTGFILLAQRWARSRPAAVA